MENLVACLIPLLLIIAGLTVVFRANNPDEGEMMEDWILDSEGDHSG